MRKRGPEVGEGLVQSVSDALAERVTLRNWATVRKIEALL